jgi:hypothetical protein
VDAPRRTRTPADPSVRPALIDCYSLIAQEFAGVDNPGWSERIDALRSGETVVEPGWILRRVCDGDFDVFGLYRVDADGRIERDRRIEQGHRDRFRRSRSADEERC